MDLIETTVTCPYCWEPIAVLLDPSGGNQAYVEDCQVCCNPIQIRIRVSLSGEAEVDVERAQ